jgi:nitrogen regulatory protein PII
MKLIRGVIRPSQLEKVREVLTGLGVEGMTVSEVRGFGRQKGHTETYRGAEYHVQLVPKLEIEVVVPDGRVPLLLDAIRRAAQTGQIGDGKLFVEPVLDAFRIRTGEHGEDAL